MPSSIKTEPSRQSLNKRRELSYLQASNKEKVIPKKPQLKRIKCCRAITVCPVDSVAAEALVVSCTADGVPVGGVDERRGPSPPVSCRGLLATRAQRNLGRNICRGPAEREPVT